MNEIDWSNLSFGYMKTDYNVRVITATANGAIWNFVLKKH